MMVGMGSVAAAVIGAPLTMVFLVLEGTGNFPMTVGVMVGVVIASTIVRLTFGYSFSTWRFHQRGLGIRSPHDIGWLADLNGRPPDALRSQGRARDHAVDGDAREVSRRAARSAYSSFPMAAPSSARSTSPRSTTPSATNRSTAAPRAISPSIAISFLLPFENVRTALARFEEKEVEALPVLASDSDHIGGRLSHRAVCLAPLQPGARAPAQRRSRRTRPVLDRRAAAIVLLRPHSSFAGKGVPRRS